MNYEQIWKEWSDSTQFSGVFSVGDKNNTVFEKCVGLRNKSENLPNNRDTAFGIASGTKLFTGLAVCKLIDEGKLSIHARICDILPYSLGQIDKNVTVFHLLTHTSGVGDYIDEDSENCEEQLQALYDKYPVQLWTRLEYYLQMITPLPPKFKPSERYGYSNSGFILLGLVIEAVSGISYQQYVYEVIISPCKLKHTGFYRADSLPANVALGYMEDGDGWNTNIFSLPILGGSDGGLYTCADDLDKLWRAVFKGTIFSENMLAEFIKKQSEISEIESYGFGVYRHEVEDKIFYYAVGGDAGVDFFTAYSPEQQIVFSALGNTSVNTYPLMEKVFAVL
ncbi:MAG: beta-lactamase family protein [Defluviitaleaceae bacterium]|nr:beta-lactamase family protein [Defluviitaleaceae bacterium]MCL2189759.1 beta-lactamase family protein [Defluviitaleaceae bacterium]MCL2275391.1 beta-lactamase family protein [Defluviitaleaceae bacterium]